MMMKVVLVFLCAISTCRGDKRRKDVSARPPQGEQSDAKTCSNLTLVLDNWKFAILTQVKDLLIKDHASVLPEYSRIQPLSDALADLYKRFNTLKDELGSLNAKLDKVEGFVDDLGEGRLAAPPRPRQWLPDGFALRSRLLRAQKRAPESQFVRRPIPIRIRRRGQQTP